MQQSDISKNVCTQILVQVLCTITMVMAIIDDVQQYRFSSCDLRNEEKIYHKLLRILIVITYCTYRHETVPAQGPLVTLVRPALESSHWESARHLNIFHHSCRNSWLVGKHMCHV